MLFVVHGIQRFVLRREGHHSPASISAFRLHRDGDDSEVLLAVVESLDRLSGLKHAERELAQVAQLSENRRSVFIVDIDAASVGLNRLWCRTGRKYSLFCLRRDDTRNKRKCYK